MSELTPAEHRQAQEIAYYKSLKRGDGQNPPLYNHELAVSDFWQAAAEVITQRPRDNSRPVLCGKCGEPLDEPTNLTPDARTPCPNCGGMARTLNVTASGGITVSGTATARLTPGKQARDWRQRLAEMKEHYKRLLAPLDGPVSAESIQNANHELQSFYVQAYHIKDSLIQDAAVRGVSRSTIENAITADPHLALLADLANLDKHQRLTSPPRSGDAPSWNVSGEAEGGPGWRLCLEIRHKGNKIDGLRFAGEAVTAWETHLQSWGLI